MRIACEADIPRIQALADEIWRRCYTEMIPPEQIQYMLHRMYSESTLRGELATGVCYWICELHSIDVGYLSMSAKPGQCGAVLHKIYVLPEYHGKGLGQRLLEHACETARAWRAQWVELRVNKANARAQRAYQRAGFQKKETVVEEIGGGFVMDDFVFRKDVGNENRGSTSAS